MTSPILKYLLNCFLLLVPVMLWDLFLTGRLPLPFQPATFWSEIPPVLTYGENIVRVLLFMLALLMPLRLETRRQKIGLIVYTVGMLAYFASWLILIFDPAGAWSNSIFGFMAPAYTPLLWLTGIALTGRSFYFSIPYKPWYFILVSAIFLVFHNIHTFLVYSRVY